MIVDVPNLHLSTAVILKMSWDKANRAQSHLPTRFANSVNSTEMNPPYFCQYKSLASKMDFGSQGYTFSEFEILSRVSFCLMFEGGGLFYARLSNIMPKPYRWGRLASQTDK